MRFLVFVLLHLLVVLIIIFSSVQAEEEWTITKFEKLSYAAVSGEVTHGDTLNFFLRSEDNCTKVWNTFTFYTYEKPEDISQLNGQKIPIQINDVPDLEAKVFMVRPFLMGYQVWFNLGNHKVDEYTKMLKGLDRFEIKILDGYGFKAKKYFDITANYWELKDVGDAFQKIKNDCLEISETENKITT